MSFPAGASTGDGLHGGIVQALRIQHHGKRVAVPRVAGKDVELQITRFIWNSSLGEVRGEEGGAVRLELPFRARMRLSGHGSDSRGPWHRAGISGSLSAISHHLIKGHTSVTAGAHPWVVLKFGGTSVSRRNRWDTIGRLASKRMAEDNARVLVVVSALVGRHQRTAGHRQRR
jgi:hypothetical protein